MPIGKVHAVLCVPCNLAVTTEYAYPERRCGYTTTARSGEGKLIHVSCTNTSGNESCGRGVHYDSFVFMHFETRGRLWSQQQGETGRA
jgi:hypothetical protein